jgi:rSAM/selenodomain-associated transferase 2
VTDAPVISIVVPVVDEAAALPGLLDHLATLEQDWEVIVADGGSRDGSREIAVGHLSHPGVVDAPRGRALQMNAGARAARGDALLFVHADSRLPANAHAAIRIALADRATLGGNFALRFDGDDRFARLLGAWYAWQRRLGVYYGDSSIWVRATIFNELGGFRELAIMEDYDFVRRLERRGRTACLPGPALTSGRRWRRLGIRRTVTSWLVIRWLYLAGVPAERLARLYRSVR